MRIGEFAKKYGLTIDTIRHYMDLELLLPDKKGGQYFFGEKEEKDLKEILELKDLKFTLSEIRKIVAYLRISQLRDKEDKDYVKGILLNKQKELKEERQEIQKAIKILEDRIHQMDPMDQIEGKEAIKTGMDLSFMQHLTCPLCKTALELEAGKITSNRIMEGSFGCKCGYTANVEEGIYVSLDDEDREKLSKEYFKSKVKPATSLGEYAEGTESSLINHIYKSIDTMINFIDGDALEDKIILELGTGSGFFIRHFLSYMDPKATYIVTDHHLDRMKQIKAYIEEHAPNYRFVYICSDLRKLPLRNEGVDYVINYLTSLNYSVKDDGFLDALILPKIRKGGRLIGCSYYLKSGSKVLKSFPPTTRRYFEEGAYKNAIRNLPLKNLEIKEVGSVLVESKYEIMIDGGELYTLAYCGEK